MIQLKWRELAMMLLHEIERTRPQPAPLSTVLKTRREESIVRWTRARSVNAFGTPIRQPRLRLFSLAWTSGRQPVARVLRSSKQEPGLDLPSRNESRLAKGRQIRQQPGVGENARFIGPVKAAQPRGVFGLGFPPGSPIAAHSL